MGKLIDLTGKRFGHWTVLKRGKSKNGHAYWVCQCDCADKTIKEVEGTSLRRGQSTSCGCSAADNLIGQTFEDLTPYEMMPREYSNGRHRAWKCRCKCGRDTIVSSNDLKSGNTTSCGVCQKSKGEKKIGEILKELSINFVKQKTFEECRDKRVLPFDFYLPDYNILIEYDGIQHFEFNRGWNSKEKFLTVQEHDKIKNNFCKVNNINLIRIPYTEYKKLNNDYILDLLR